MAFQAREHLAMVGLGIEGDRPPNQLQPTLKNGIHLRWAFGSGRGFPWYGYYLLRRPHREGRIICLSNFLKNPKYEHLQPGSLDTNSLDFEGRQLISDQNLVLTDDFPPHFGFMLEGLPEFDLQNRQYLRFYLKPGKLAKRFIVTIGLREVQNPGRPAGISGGSPDSLRTPGTTTRQSLGSVSFDSVLARRRQDIRVTAFWGNTVVAEASTEGATSWRVQLNLESDGMSAIEISSGSGALIDICWETIVLRDGDDAGGWQAIPGFPYPLCLPVTHPDYPCGGRRSARPGSFESRLLGKATSGDLQTALNRILYGPPENWGGSAFQDLRDQLLQLVVGGPGSEPMAERLANQGEEVIGEPDPPDSDAEPPRMPNQRPLDLVLLASLHPAVAQMLGLYWVDQTAEPGVCYDYLLLADHSGDLSWLRDQINNNPNFQSPLNLDQLSEDLSTAQSATPPTESGSSRSNSLEVETTRSVVRPDQPDLEQLSLSPKILDVFRKVTSSDQEDSTQNPATANIDNILGIPPEKPVEIDIYILFNICRQPAPPLAAPESVRAYALPGGTINQPDGGILDATNNAGLTWNLGLNQSGELSVDRAVMYHLWRAELGVETPISAALAHVPITVAPDPPALPPHQRRPRPILVPAKKEPTLVFEPVNEDEGPTPPSNWPPFPLHVIDRALPDGWYSYQVSGIDIFGRHSPNSKPATWHQWTPAPEPKPWYYQDSAVEGIVHPFAIQLLDKIPPPPPTAIEAYALDPADPYVLKDVAYNAWRDSLSPSERETLVGLRVSWQWRLSHFLQAPDTREFRIYYQPNHFNAEVGEIVSVTAAGDQESIVNTDLSNGLPANAYVGAYLKVGADSFSILKSEVGSPLVLRVKNLGANDQIRPPSKGNCTVSIPPGHAAFVDYTKSIAWQQRYYVVGYDEHFKEMIPAQRDAEGYELAGNSATASGASVSLGNNNPGTNHPDLSEVQANFNLLYLENDTARPSKLYEILAVNNGEKTLTLDGSPNLGGEPSAWIIGIPEVLRKYEVFLPATGDTYREDLPLEPSLADPVVYAQIGISAADDKNHTIDDPKWASGRWGGPQRFGNEGAIGSPATICRVWRQKPNPPIPPPDSERVFATPADYHSHSFYTYRWQPSEHLKTHIMRALDDSLFKVDWSQRPRSTDIPSEFFPDQEIDPRWDALKCDQVTNELNQLNGFSSNQKTEAMAVYRGLSNDALRVLAGLPGNEQAFTQITIQPLEPDDPESANRVGPDNPTNFIVDPSLRAYVDTLDGRSRNRYFYRAAYVDGANNRSDLSLSSPPIWLPNVVPPRAPVVTKVLGGERQITLRWASNREPDLSEYRIYRTDTKQATRDLRLMTLVHTESVPSGDPLTRPAEVVWTDESTPGLVTFYYRIVAVDEDGNISSPSRSLAARAFDETPPEVPIVTAEWIDIGEGILRSRLSWSSIHETLLQRRISATEQWIAIASWMEPGEHIYDDKNAESNQSYDYRLWVRKTTGTIAISNFISLVSANENE